MSGFLSILDRTMLIERGTGVFVYALVLFIVYYALRSAKNFHSFSLTLNIYVIILCIMAYFYIPASSADLYRWWDIIQYWPRYSFSEFWKNYILRCNCPAAYLLMYLCSITGNLRTLPMVCALVFYSNIFYIFKDQYRQHGVPTKVLSTSLLLIMASGSFLQVISGVRCLMSLSILARCFYDEFYNDKPIAKNIVIEIIAALIHQMALVLLIIRILFSLIWNSKTSTKRTLNILLVIILSLLAYIFGSDYIHSAFSKAGSYALGSNSYSFFWGYCISIILFAQYGIILWNFRGKNLPIHLKMILIFNLVIVLVELIFIYEYNIFHRTTIFSTMTMIPLISELKNLEYRCNPKAHRYLNYLSLLMLVISCTRGDLSAYKFFLL